jgi:hypothetical protein
MGELGARRRVGFALLLSAVAMIAVAALIFGGVIPTGGDLRLVVSGAVAAAALVDAVLGIVFITRHAG